MILPPIVSSTIALISRGFDGILEWIDAHVNGAPIMHERINKGSDKFFAAEEERKRFELDGSAFDSIADD